LLQNPVAQNAPGRGSERYRLDYINLTSGLPVVRLVVLYLQSCVS